MRPAERSFLSLCAVLTLVIVTPTAAQVTKCVGPDGKVTYTDGVCDRGASQLKLEARPSSSDQSSVRSPMRSDRAASRGSGAGVPAAGPMRSEPAIVATTTSQPAQPGSPVASGVSRWVVETERDSMTDRERKSATVRNAAGFKLSFYRAEGGEVWMLFALPQQSLDVLGSPLPMFRIDKLKAEEIESSKRLSQLISAPMVKAEPKWVNVRVWHGKGEPLSGTLRDFMEGNEVVFRYWLFTGGSKETSFDLRGGKQAIAEALAVAADPDPAAVRADRESKARLQAAIARCDAEFPIAGGDRTMIRNNIECKKRAAAEAGK